MNRRTVFYFGVALLLLGGRGSSASAQSSEVLNTGHILAEFDDAQAVAVDPRGRLYVVDAARDAVVVLDETGRQLQVLGGPGSRPGEFDSPSDVEPTNSQVMAVADTYNGRVQRFSGDGQYLESLAVDADSDGRSGERAYNDGGQGAAIRGTGQPVAVASNARGALYILERTANTIHRWTALDGGEPIVRGSLGRSDLVRPVDLAIGSEGRMYVADAGREEVLVYGPYGRYERALPTPRLKGLRAVAIHSTTVWVACRDRVYSWNRETKNRRELRFPIQRSIVDVAIYDFALYVLTSDRLIKYSIG